MISSTVNIFEHTKVKENETLILLFLLSETNRPLMSTRFGNIKQVTGNIKTRRCSQIKPPHYCDKTWRQKSWMEEVGIFFHLYPRNSFAVAFIYFSVCLLELPYLLQLVFN